MNPGWKNRIVSHGDEHPEQLLANPANFRRHPKHQRAALRKVLGEVGWVQDVIVNRVTGHLVDGHLRVELAVLDGATSVPVKYVDLSADEERMVLATFDPIGAMADADARQYQALVDHLAKEDVVLDETIAAVAQRQHPPSPSPQVPDERDALRVDHTVKFLEAGEIDYKHTTQDMMNSYQSTTVRQITLIMDMEQYADALTRMQHIMRQNKFTTNTEVFFWLLNQAGV